jgi:salicylate hydroxylase
LLRFDDGSTHTADTVVGCDGFRSKVRQLVLGPDNAANAPVFAGFWDARGLLPTQQAVEKFGIDIIDARADQLTAVVGDGSFILSGPIDNGQMTFINVVGTPPPGWDGSALKTELDREHLERAFRGWDERFVKGIVDCVMTSGPGVIFNQWESAPSPKYFNGNICMIGDAAHATSNWSVSFPSQLHMGNQR